MPHARQLIRDALVQALIDASTAAGTRVFPSRYLPIRRSEIPAIAVYLNSEDVDPDSWETAPVLLVREPDVMIQGWVEAEVGVDIDDQLDDLAVEIEAVVHADDNIAGIERIRLANTEKTVTPDGDRLTGLIVMRYVARYRQEAIAAPVLDDFLEAHASYDLGADAPEVDSILVQE